MSHSRLPSSMPSFLTFIVNLVSTTCILVEVHVCLKQQALACTHAQAANALCCPQTCTSSLYPIIITNLAMIIETLIWMDRISILPMDRLTKTKKQDNMT